MAVPKGWIAPEKCDQCSHSVDDHVLFEPDVEEAEDGWMFCTADDCKTCWHRWSFVDGRQLS